MSNRRERAAPIRSEAAKFISMVKRMLKAAGRRAGEADVEDLKELLSLRQSLDDAIVSTVAALRASGATWQDIAEATGTSQPAAVMKWSAKVKALGTFALGPE